MNKKEQEIQNIVDKLKISYDEALKVYEFDHSTAKKQEEILQNLGYDVRVLQLEGAKDPDEFVIKYGSGRFKLAVDQAISLVEFKVKNLKNNLNLELASDKIKFLNEVTKILSKVDNEIEKEVYIDKIASEYKISKDAIYAQSNKLLRKNNQSQKSLEMPKINRNIVRKQEENKISDAVIKKENMVISLIINNDKNIGLKLKEKILPQDFKSEKNKKIIEKLYEELEKGNSNINGVISSFEDEELINHITYIMAYDFEITDVNKATEDLIQGFEREKLIRKRNEILKKMEDPNLEKQELANLEKSLSEIIILLAKMK